MEFNTVNSSYLPWSGSCHKIFLENISNPEGFYEHSYHKSSTAMLRKIGENVTSDCNILLLFSLFC